MGPLTGRELRSLLRAWRWVLLVAPLVGLVPGLWAWWSGDLRDPGELILFAIGGLFLGLALGPLWWVRFWRDPIPGEPIRRRLGQLGLAMLWAVATFASGLLLLRLFA